MTEDAIWERALDEAWGAFCAETIGVGAVIADGSGDVVAVGRNAIVGSSAADVALAGTTLAHAEINAIAQLGSERPGEHLTLWTTLQPCWLCLSASILGGIDSIAYLSPDPLWAGTERLPEINEFVRSRWPEPRYTPHERYTSLAWTLAVHDLVRDRRNESVAIAAADEAASDLMAVADAAVADGVLARARAAGSDWRSLGEQWPPPSSGGPSG